MIGLTFGLLVTASACSSGSDDSIDPADSGDLAVPADRSSTPGDGSSNTSDPAGGGSTELTTEDTGWVEERFALVPIVDLDQPTVLTSRPGSPDLWLAERAGRVRLVERDLDPDAGVERLRLRQEAVIDLTSQVTTEVEGGLLGMAFSADGQQLYLHYTDQGGDSVVSEVPMGEETADLAQERILLRVEQPYPNHNGGHVTFGPDGMLYIGLGDGGSGGDPEGNGQNTNTLLGAILRIDPAPNGAKAYTIPADNPFVDTNDGSRPEIWVWGLRNPWRFSFDAATGNLWIADVGQDEVEEINQLVDQGQGPGRGANLGWNLMEANEPFAGAAPAGHVAPLYAYRHDGGRCSVTGGYVYRGEQVAALDGVYLYSDYCSGGITGLQAGVDGLVVADLQLDEEPDAVIGFGQGPDGEVYVLEQGGMVSRIQVIDSPIKTELER
ncbi:MAG: PQQ-dependent sugar dehydrogenase [Actinomycetia bacterium]|nr:PQQ-dependent sugar dehydrogenase [Actinomycetes bacterium]